MKNKDIHEWLLDEGIDPLTTVTTEKGEYYLSDILEKHLTEQLRLFTVVGRSEQLPCDCNVKLAETTLQVYCPKCYKTHKMK